MLNKIPKFQKQILRHYLVSNLPRTTIYYMKTLSLDLIDLMSAKIL
jgi:hypothetical protein